MRAPSWFLGLACGGVVAAVGGVALVGGADRADGQGGVTVSAEQLRINQRISQASVRRSNRALNYLAPIRTAASDAADNGDAGVRPLTSVPGAGLGWTSAQIADDAITAPKLADGAVTEAALAQAVRNRLPVWAVVEASGALRRGSPGVTSLRVAAGNYRVDTDRDLRLCAYTGTQDEVTAANIGFVGIEVDATDETRLFVRTTDQAGASADRAFNVQITC
jgi:hypothetical protein